MWKFLRWLCTALCTALSWLCTALIPGGMTSFLHVCDAVMNGPLKPHARAWYQQLRAKKVREKMDADGNLKQFKVKVTRNEFIEGMQSAFKDAQKLQEQTPSIKKTFQDCGQDPAEYPDLVEFANYLEKHAGTYGVATKEKASDTDAHTDQLEANQMAVELEGGEECFVEV